MELKDGFSGVNLQFSENCIELHLSASAWLKTGFNPKSKAIVLGGLRFPSSPRLFIAYHPTIPSVQGPFPPDIEQPLALQDSAELEASWEKLSSKPASRNAVLPIGNYLHSQMRMTQIARAVTTCWENIIWRTAWATSTPIPSCCAHFRVPLTVYEGKSQWPVCRSNNLVLRDYGFLKSPGRFHHHGQDLDWGWSGRGLAIAWR